MSLPTPRRTFLQDSIALAAAALRPGCGGGGGDTPAALPASGSDPTVDFFHLAVVPWQVTTQATFEVQVVADHLEPAKAVVPPTVTDAFGTVRAMAKKMLQWPGTTDDSVDVWAVTVPLKTSTKNALVVTSGTKSLDLAVEHKATLGTRVATDAATLRSFVHGALTDPGVDLIEVGYDEPDLGAVLDLVGNGVTATRSAWLTIRPAAGRSVGWNRDSGTAMRRPKANWLNLEGIVFGSDACDGGGGHCYAEPGHSLWLHRLEFRGKYKPTWPKTVKLTAACQTDVRMTIDEGQQQFFTDCLWDGTAQNVAVLHATLARDLRFKSHRGDYCDFGGVFLNAIAEDATPIRNFDDTDYLHNDGFQIWGSRSTADLVFKGFRVVSPTIAAELQPFLFDRTRTPDYVRVLIDTVRIEGSNTILKAQLAGKIADSRVSNLSFPGQSLVIRQDFVETNGAFAPTNVHVAGIDVKYVEYVAPAGSPNQTFRASNVANPNDISASLQAIAALAGATFSNIKVSGA